MSSLVGTLVRGTISTAYGAARHPIATATQAVGLARSAVELGIGVAHGRIPGSPQPGSPQPVSEQPVSERSSSQQPSSSVQPASAPPTTERSGAAPTGAPLEPVTEAPGEPQGSIPPRIPTPDEVAVRAAGPMPGAPGESFATEPKVASREVEHGGSATGDREAVDGFLEEMEAGEPESPIDAIGSTTVDLEPGEQAALLSEAATMRRAAERDPED